jgi:threonine/homoserine/homoserine lactone efflux protein
MRRHLAAPAERLSNNDRHQLRGQRAIQRRPGNDAAAGARYAAAFLRSPAMLVDSATLIVYVPVVTAMALTPGSDTLFILSRSLASGAAAGFVTGLGICTGLAIFAAAVGLGLAGIFDYSPLAYDIVRGAGVLYLLFLAFQAFKASAAPIPSAAAPAPRALARFFHQGLLNNLANPKAAVFFVALFPQFLVPSRGNLLGQALVLITIANAIEMVVVAIIALSAGRLGRLLARNPLVGRVQQRLVGCIFIGLAARLALADRRP